MNTAEQPPPGWRFRIGVSLFILGFFSPLSIPLVTATSLSTAWKTTLSGLLMLGIPELLWLVAAGIMGKPGFNYLKAKVFVRCLQTVCPAAKGKPDALSAWAGYAGHTIAIWVAGTLRVSLDLRL
jgi:hypothetical protein